MKNKITWQWYGGGSSFWLDDISNPEVTDTNGAIRFACWQFLVLGCRYHFEPRDLYLKCLLYHKVSNLKFKFSLPLSLTLVRCAVLILDYFATLCRVCFIHGAIMLIYRLYKPVIFWESLQDICIFDVRGSTSFDLRIDTLKFRVQSSWDKQKQFIYFNFQLWIKSERHIVNIWLVKYKTVESG